MGVYLENTQCCALEEIYGLIDYSDPKKAMKSFCEGLKCYGSDTLRDPGALLLFTGVEKTKDATEDDLDIDYGADDYEPTGYAQAFADFIKKEKLGVVVKGPAAYNRVNHPTHYVRPFFWKPNYKALCAWWKENK